MNTILENENLQKNDEKENKSFLSLFDATTLVAGSMVGSGIFIVSANIAKQVQSATLLLIVWLIAGVMTIMAALCYAEYSASLPQAGGQYVFLKKVWGEVVGFLYGWTLFLVIQSGAVAAVAVAFAKFTGVMFPAISEHAKLFSVPINIAGLHTHLAVSTEQTLAILLILVLTFVNTRGVKEGAVVQNIFTVTKMLALLGIVLAGVFFGINMGVIKVNFAHALTLPDLGISPLSAVAIAMVGSLFASDSWNNVTFIASEIKNPKKNLPIALLLGTGVVTVFYILINMLYLSVLTIPQIQHSDIVGVTLIGSIFGNSSKVIIAIIVMISAFGCVNGYILAGSRVYYAMAKDGLFFKFLAKLDEKTNVPTNSLKLQCLWACLLVMTGKYADLLDYDIFAALLFYILVIGGVIVFRKKFPDINRPYKTVLYPYLPIAYCILATIISVNLLIYKPMYTWPGLLIVLSGLPVYYFWKNKQKVSLNDVETTEQAG